MGYLFYYIFVLPCLIGGLVLSIKDIRSRSVPRSIIVQALVCQGFFLLFFLSLGLFGIIIIAILLGIVAFSALIQYGLYKISRGALSFGDVTATAVCAFILAPCVPFKPELWLIWWIIMGLMGIAHMALYHILGRGRSIPFVPDIYISAVITSLLGSAMMFPHMGLF